MSLIVEFCMCDLFLLNQLIDQNCDEHIIYPFMRKYSYGNIPVFRHFFTVIQLHYDSINNYTSTIIKAYICGCGFVPYRVWS